MKNEKTLKNSIATGKVLDEVVNLCFRSRPTNYTEKPTNYTEKPTNYTEKPTNYTEDLKNYGVTTALVGGKKSVNIYKDI
jgi:hypothetical protein